MSLRLPQNCSKLPKELRSRLSKGYKSETSQNIRVVFRPSHYIFNLTKVGLGCDQELVNHLDALTMPISKLIT